MSIHKKNFYNSAQEMPDLFACSYSINHRLVLCFVTILVFILTQPEGLNAYHRVYYEEIK